MAEPVRRSRRDGGDRDIESERRAAESARAERDDRPSSESARGARRSRERESSGADLDDRDRLYARGAYAGAYDFELDDPSLADELLDDLIPPEINWRRLVRRHPWPALLIAGLGGYLLGRSQGRALVGALAGLAVARVEDRVLGLVEDELEDE